MSEWKEYYLTELGQLARGKSKHRPRWAPHLYGGNYPFIQTGEITATDKYIDKYENTYSEAGLAQSKLWPKNTLCITIAANIAEIAILKFPACFPDSVLGFIPDEEKGDLDFIFYTLKYFRNRIQNLAIGSVQDNINLGTFKLIKFNIPPLNEQRQIAAILSSLDDEIDLLRRQNDTLEQIAQTLFKRWFVEFEFPVQLSESGFSGLNDLQDEEWKDGQNEEWKDFQDEARSHSCSSFNPENPDSDTYKSSGGKMVPSELGEIPAGWRVGVLNDEFEIIMGQSPPGTSYNENGEGMIFFQGRTDFGFRFPTIRLYTTDPKRIAEKFDTLVSVRAPVGDVNMAFEKCCIGRGLSAVRSKYKPYCYYKIKSFKGQFNIFESEGTVFGSLSKENFNNLENLIPPKETILAFDKIVRPIDMKIYNNEKQIQTLTRLRDILLPKLVSGKIRV